MEAENIEENVAENRRGVGILKSTCACGVWRMPSSRCYNNIIDAAATFCASREGINVV